ncbi:MAG: nucleotidyltransferase domain-containing protein [Candidatus Woesearchaeota archaeon]
MKFDIKKKKSAQTQHYSQEDIDIAYAFSKEVWKECGSMLKGVVLFGSLARRTTKESSDIDILIVVDDLTIELSKELMQTYKIIVEKLVHKISKKIHVTTLKFTTFYEYVHQGDPIGLNILRDGVALIDTGFFDPLQVLLFKGKIRPTFESIWTYFNKAPITLNNSRWHLFRACEDLYWAVTDASHALIMKLGVVPPAPEYLPVLLKRHAVSQKILTAKDISTVKFFFDLYKSITKRTLKDVTGQQYEKYYVDAQNYVKKIESFLHTQYVKK